MYGSNYTGVQRYSKLGKLCYDWGDAAIPDSRGPLYTAANYPDSNLVSNYCRNPFQDSDRYKAKTIWCFTQDPDYNWQECNPIGQIRPVCDGGYDINSEELRIVLEVLAYILWVLAFIYCIVVCCLDQQDSLSDCSEQGGFRFRGAHPYDPGLACCAGLGRWALDFDLGPLGSLFAEPGS